MPPLSDEEYAALKQDIAESGVRVPVVEDAEGGILDGHHRVRAWNELRDEGVEVRDYPRDVRDVLMDEGEKRDIARKLNMARRHLSSAQKRNVVAAKLKESPEWANNRIASLLGVSDDLVGAVRRDEETNLRITKVDELVGADGKKRSRYASKIEREGLEGYEVKRTLRGEQGGLSDEEIAQHHNVGAEFVGEMRQRVRHGDEQEKGRVRDARIRRAEEKLRNVRPKKLPPERRWFHGVYKIAAALNELVPQEVAEANLDQDNYERQQQTVRDIIDWLRRYDEAMKKSAADHRRIKAVK